MIRGPAHKVEKVSGGKRGGEGKEHRNRRVLTPDSWDIVIVRSKCFEGRAQRSTPICR